MSRSEDVSRPEDLPALSEAQLEILNVVWDRERATVAEVWEVLSAERELARNTVQTTMSRLAEKGWLLAERKGQAFEYRVAVPRDVARRSMLSRWVDRVFDGSASGLVLALLGEQTLTRAEANRIREALREAERRGS